jgi:hypothetical protein
MSLAWRGFILTVIAATSACDPVGDAAQAALGPETPGVRQGPLHRPGQPCLVCHDGALGDPPAFSVAGTIYQTPSSAAGVEGASVFLSDSSDGGDTQYMTLASNAAGNFYVTPDQWNPVFPITSVVVVSATKTVIMQSDIGRNGACASCHVNPTGPASPGQVCITLDDGGTPP